MVRRAPASSLWRRRSGLRLRVVATADSGGDGRYGTDLARPWLFGPRLESGLPRLSSFAQGIDRTGVTLPHPALASLFLVGLSRVGLWSWRTVNLSSEVLK